MGWSFEANKFLGSRSTDSLAQRIRVIALLGGRLCRDVSDNPSLGARLKADLTSNVTVSVVAVLCALVALFAFAQVDGSPTGSLLLALNVAVFVPYAYEQYWPVEYAGGAAVVWTVSAALITVGLFVGVYQLALGVAPTEYTAGIAFLVTVAVQYAATTLFMRVRQNA